MCPEYESNPQLFRVQDDVPTNHPGLQLILFKPHNNPVKCKLHYCPYMVGEETGPEKVGYFRKVSQPFRDKVEGNWTVAYPVPERNTANHWAFLPLTEHFGPGWTSPTAPPYL